MISLGEARYDPRVRAVSSRAGEARLEPRVADLLDRLIARAGETVEREELLDSVWGDEGSDEALTQAVSKLRAVLGDKDLIRTEPRRGYALIATPQAMPRPATPVMAEPVAATREQPLVQPTILRAFAIGLIAGVILASITFAIFFRPVVITETSVLEPGSDEPITTFRCEGGPDDCPRE